MISQETIKAKAEWNRQENQPDAEGNQGSERPEIDFGATVYALLNDLPRLKAMCWATFKIYKKIMDQPTMNKTLIMMMCAPVRVCKSLSVDLVCIYVNLEGVFDYQALHNVTLRY